MIPETRFPELTPTDDGCFRLTIGATAITLTDTEARFLLLALHDAIHQPTAALRLDEALNAAIYEVQDIIKNNARLARLYSLTDTDVDRLIDLYNRTKVWK